MRLCILDNDILEPEAAARWGSYGRMSEQLLRRNGFAGEVVCSLAREQRYPADLDRFDALLLTGSRADAFGDEPWVQALREWVGPKCTVDLGGPAANRGGLLRGGRWSW